MATDSITVADPWGSVHNTLAAGTEDVVTVNGVDGGSYKVEVFNRSGSGGFYVGTGGSAAVAEANGTVYVPAGGSFAWMDIGVTLVRVISSAADPYSVHVVPQSAWS